MKILFLSRTIPEKFAEKVFNEQKDAMQSAAINFQRKIISGVENNLQQPSNLFNLMPIYSYPKYYRHIFVKGEEFSHVDGSQDYNVGFFNLMYIKQIFLKSSYLWQFRKYIKNRNFDAVICYTPDAVLLSAVKVMKKRYPQVKNCVVIPDMPEFINLSSNQSIFRQTYNTYLAKQSRKMNKYIDSFVYLTEQSAGFWCDTKPYVVVEGIVDRNDTGFSMDKKESEKKVILYTGTTNAQFGILCLLEAFSLIEGDEYELQICGCGDADDVIRNKVKRDKRIKFFGVLLHEEVAVLQKQATVLVNPRQNIGEYTKYSFPSKTMEYLSSGVPVVAYKLSGIPKEYDNYINYVGGNHPQDLANVLQAVCNWSSEKRSEFGKRAKEFVFSKKNKEEQTKKIINMLVNL